MVIVPVFRTCNPVPELASILGSGEDMRLWEFGCAPDEPETPYAVWQVVTGTPDNTIDCAAHTDNITIQLDVYDTKPRRAIETGQALRKVIEDTCYITRIHPSTRDKQTRLYRVGFDADWIMHRQPD